jgi:Na+/melibiose symporter-like transporter
VLAFAGAGFLGPGDEKRFALICLLSGACLGADLCLPSALAADLGHALQRPGSVFGVWNLVAKLNLAAAAGCALPILGLAGYAPGTGSGVATLTLAYSLIPLLFKTCAAALLWRWRAHLEVST